MTNSVKLDDKTREKIMWLTKYLEISTSKGQGLNDILGVYTDDQEEI